MNVRSLHEMNVKIQQNTQLKGFSILSASIIYLTVFNIRVFETCWLHSVNEFHYLQFIWMQCIYTRANLVLITFLCMSAYNITYICICIYIKKNNYINVKPI